MKKLILPIAVVLIAGLEVSAQENESILELTGSSNAVEIDQVGTYNFSRIKQGNEGNQAIIGQEGQWNYSLIDQSDTQYSSAHVVQEGPGNTSLIFQESFSSSSPISPNVTKLYQIGAENLSEIRQEFNNRNEVFRWGIGMLMHCTKSVIITLRSSK